MNAIRTPVAAKPRRSRRVAVAAAIGAAAAVLAVVPGTAAAAPAGASYDEYDMALDISRSYQYGIGFFPGGCDEWGCGMNHNEVMATRLG